ncbi:MAG TPA: hydantoinase/oxoprolinase family protein [Baekduia sp.]|uniref:hydantoinase/oxoprolinase family protein n=1 Tax=Baekduia sp. TaxID=2600305 RepID=UPI002C43F317|nr:hydantoinase/oxoprolinase family protein [Baekduia sp.]HMJ35332.1 hydantoinase/oxoprolinase family protein [Baekduia sp.]
MLLGVDVGGTFTDAVLVDGGRLITAKAPTTPDDQSRGVLDAVQGALRAAGREAGDVEAFAHGMTVATNALLEGVGARTVLCATEGFVDVVELGRQARPELYRLCVAGPAPLVPPSRRVAVPERMGPDGVLRALDAAGAAAVADEVAALEPEAVAVVLLHAYRHPAHERVLGEALRARLGDGVHVSLSHEVTATFREFERAATTEVDAALSPLLRRYLRRLVAGAAEAGLPEPAIMQSSGGLADAAQAAGHAALTVLSGPAGGAAAAALLSARLDEPDLLCFDMGGTSCDVCVVEGGAVRASAGREIGGRPLALPMVDIHTVGAGGGSIAWRDAGGALRVGPRSAGADPGPACYGRGGTEPTVTDANLVLGFLDAERPLAGGVRLDAGAALDAVRRLADELGLDDARAAAAGIVRVANTEMVRALRVVTVERGIDPRRFALLAFGGAGPLHAAAIADELGITRIVVPRAAGVLSALGLAAADRRRDEARSVLLRGSELTDSALARLAGDADEVTWDARYAGQSHELALRGVEPSAAAVREAFAAAHEERYGYRDDEADVELVTVRTARIEPGPEVRWEHDGAVQDVAGPAVLALPEATLVVPAGWSGRTDATGTVILEREVAA